MPNKVSISNDIAMPLYPLCACLHKYLGPPPAPVQPTYLPIAVAAEIPVPMFWPPGFAMGQNQLANKVLHKTLMIVQAGHDCGVLIIHVQIVASAANVFTALHIPFSSRKTNFSCSTVVTQGKATACATLISLPPAPMTSCWEPVSPPLSSAETSHLNTVEVTMSWADIIIGWCAVVASMVLDYVFSRGGSTPTGYWSALGKGLLGKLIPTDKKGLIQLLCKQGLGVATGVARLIFTDGPVDVKIEVGSPYLKVSVGVSRDSSGNYSSSASVRSANRSGQAKYDEGQVSTERSQGGLGGPAGGTDKQATAGGTTTRSTTTPSWHPGHWGRPL